MGSFLDFFRPAPPPAPDASWQEAAASMREAAAALRELTATLKSQPAPQAPAPVTLDTSELVATVKDAAAGLGVKLDRLTGKADEARMVLIDVEEAIKSQTEAQAQVTRL